MKNKRKISSVDLIELRREADALFKKNKGGISLPETKEELFQLVQELEVHQIELEIINEELQESRAEVEIVLEQYTDLYEFAPVGYFTISLDGSIRRVNLNGSFMLGVERSKLLKSRFVQFLCKDSQLLFSDLIREAIDGKIKASFEVSYIKDVAMDQEIINPVRLYAHIETSFSNSEQEIRIAMVDITERKLAEEELLRYEEIVASSKDMQALLDNNYTYYVVNDAYLNAFGYKKDQVIGHTISDVFGNDFFEKVIKPNADRCLVGNDVQCIEWFEFPKYGRLCMDVTYSPYVNSDKKLKGFIVTGHNITDLRMAEEKASNLAKFPSENPLPVLRIDKEGILLFANEASQQILHFYKCNIGEIVPKFLRDLVVDTLTSQSKKKIEKIIGEITYSFLIAPVSKAGYVNLYGEDITERKRNEEELKKYEAHLEEMIEERMLELSEKDKQLEFELSENKKTSAALLISNKELESFSYSVSHDLRAPIRAIDGFTRKLFEEYNSVLDDEGKRLLDVVLKNTKNMGVLIDDLLKLSRLGRKKIEPSEINMEELINEVISGLYDLDLDKKPEITVKHLPVVYGDRELIRHVIFNLLSNSIKFSASREKPAIEFGNLTRDHHNVYYIKDNGVGFNMKYASKLFEVFQRLHSLKDFDGTGVGLAIVQRIIQRHGGEIWAESEVDKGATFFFTL